MGKAISIPNFLKRGSPQKKIYTDDEYDFLPDYLKIIKRPAALWARRTAWGISLLLCLIFLGLFVGKLDIHATALGKVIVADYSKTIQPLEPAVVIAINVKEGEAVHQGQVLMKLSPSGVEAEVRNIEQQLTHRRLEKARLMALLTGQPLSHFILLSEDESHLIDSSHQLLQQERDEIEQELKRQEVELAINKTHYQSIENKIISQEKLLANIEQRLNAYRSLAKMQSIAHIELLEKEREGLTIKAELSELKGQKTVLLSQQQNYKQNQQLFLAKKKREHHERLNQADEAIHQFIQEKIKIADRQRLQTLQAPVSGIVQQLAVHTLGGVVTSAQQLMVIVPDHNILEIDVMLLNKDVGFVSPGQQVDIKVDSFPYTRYGTLQGIIKHISLDAVDDAKQGLVFPARIRLLNDRSATDIPFGCLKGEGCKAPFRLSAGMSVKAEIKTGRRRVIDYLISPLEPVQNLL